MNDKHIQARDTYYKTFQGKLILAKHLGYDFEEEIEPSSGGCSTYINIGEDPETMRWGSPEYIAKVIDEAIKESE